MNSSFITSRLVGQSGSEMAVIEKILFYKQNKSVIIFVYEPVGQYILSKLECLYLNDQKAIDRFIHEKRSKNSRFRNS